MEKMTIIANELIPVYKNEQSDKLVSARELHEWLESKQEFANWIKGRIEQYGFTENIDFTTFDKIIKRENSNLGSKRVEYIITLNMAKELSMIERTRKGREARCYFIKCEEKLKEFATNVSSLSPELQMFNSLFQAIAKTELNQKRLEKEVAESKKEIQNIKDTIVLSSNSSWRRNTNIIFTKIGFKTKDFVSLRNKSYEALENRGKCNLSVRLKNLKERAIRAGISKSKSDTLNVLDVIENDARLKEIYISIVKEIAIKNNVSLGGGFDE